MRLDDVGPQAPLLVDHHVDGVQGLRMPGSAELAETLSPYIADRLCDTAGSVEPALEVSPELTSSIMADTPAASYRARL